MSRVTRRRRPVSGSRRRRGVAGVEDAREGGGVSRASLDHVHDRDAGRTALVHGGLHQGRQVVRPETVDAYAVETDDAHVGRNVETQFFGGPDDPSSQKVALSHDRGRARRRVVQEDVAGETTLLHERTARHLAAGIREDIAQTGETIDGRARRSPRKTLGSERTTRTVAVECQRDDGDIPVAQFTQVLRSETGRLTVVLSDGQDVVGRVALDGDERYPALTEDGDGLVETRAAPD